MTHPERAPLTPASAGLRPTRIDGYATGSLSTFPYFIIHNWHTHPSSKYLRSVHTLTEGPSLLVFPQSARTSAALSSERRARRQAIPSCRPQGPGCCSFHPRTNGEIVVGEPREARRIPEVPAGIVREFAGTGSARLAAASPVQVPRHDRCRTGYAEGQAGIRQDGPASWPDGRLDPVGRASNTTESSTSWSATTPCGPPSTPSSAPGQWPQANLGGEDPLKRPIDARRRPVTEWSPESVATRAGPVVRRVGSRANAHSSGRASRSLGRLADCLEAIMSSRAAMWTTTRSGP